MTVLISTHSAAAHLHGLMFGNAPLCGLHA